MAYTYKGKQLTDTILMVNPVDFQYNAETAVDNEFQHTPDNLEHSNLAQKAISEFNEAIKRLESAGINVIKLNYAPAAQPTPDAVFPNNWISMHHSGLVVLYPMHAPNRRMETERFPLVQSLLKENNFLISSTKDLRPEAAFNRFLEGTGSMIFDHTNQIIYASISARTNPESLSLVKDLLGYKRIVVFRSASSTGKEVYHTNVILSIGETHAIICSAAIPDEREREMVMNALSAHHEVIDITLEQCEKYFCGNTLQVVNKAGIKVIVMSRSAYNGFTEEQKEQLRNHGELLPLPIDTIEYIGGGSARCMMAEVFLPKAQ